MRSVAREVWGLFVDDGSFAAAILVWLTVVSLGIRTVAWGAKWGGVALFAGLALVLIENVLRYARKRGK
ncbi:MAG TPA: hypothetical protein VHU44_06635 [Acidobacteriaceae bacterium]|nr:hypothetical protein [Acidobacteriaceae bacterium]